MRTGRCFALLLAIALWPSRAFCADSFYAIPDGARQGLPGTLLKAEPVAPPPGAGAAYRIIYRSRNHAGRPVAISGLVALPPAGRTAGGRPLVAWGHGTSGVATRCAPSRNPPQAFARIGGLADLLAGGVIVAATDYGGLGEAGQHSYLLGTSEAHAMIDAVRAARRLPGADAGERYAAWGFSQGGHAALFTAATARVYAPEMHLAGVAAAAAPTELRRLLRDDIGTLPGQVVASFAAWSWGQAYGLPLDGIVRPQAIGTVDGIAADCSLDPAGDVALGLSALGYAQTGFLRSAADRRPGWDQLIARNSNPDPRGVPVFFAQGSLDALVEPATTRDYVGRLCRAGTSVTYVEVPWASHGGVVKAVAPMAVSWLLARLSGAPVPNGCLRAGR